MIFEGIILNLKSPLIYRLAVDNRDSCDTTTVIGALKLIVK